MAAGERADLLAVIEAVAAQGAVVGQRLLQVRDAAEPADAEPPPPPREPPLVAGLEGPPAGRADEDRGGDAAGDGDADDHPGAGVVAGHDAFASLPLSCFWSLSLFLAPAFLCARVLKDLCAFGRWRCPGPGICRRRELAD